MSFQMAGRIAFKKAMEQAKPTILEPVMAVEITVPDDFAGSTCDLNSARTHPAAWTTRGNTIVKAEVPMAEMLTYGADLTSMTQGRGSFNMEMHHTTWYRGNCRKKIIEKAKRGTGRGERGRRVRLGVFTRRLGHLAWRSSRAKIETGRTGPGSSCPHRFVYIPASGYG